MLLEREGVRGQEEAREREREKRLPDAASARDEKRSSSSRIACSSLEWAVQVFFLIGV